MVSGYASSQQRLLTTTCRASAAYPAQEGKKMEYYEIAYYRTHNWIDKRYVCSELGVGHAIMKSRVKRPIEVAEISKERYETQLAKKREIAALKKEAFIL
jgi:hypothetical protein